MIHKYCLTFLLATAEYLENEQKEPFPTSGTVNPTAVSKGRNKEPRFTAFTDAKQKDHYLSKFLLYTKLYIQSFQGGLSRGRHIVTNTTERYLLLQMDTVYSEKLS